MSDYPRPISDQMAAAIGRQPAVDTATGVRRLTAQTAEVLVHLDETVKHLQKTVEHLQKTVEHLDSIALETRQSGEQNRRMLSMARWTLVAAILTLVTTLGAVGITVLTQQQSSSEIAGYGPCIEEHRDAAGNISADDVDKCLELHSD